MKKLMALCLFSSAAFADPSLSEELSAAPAPVAQNLSVPPLKTTLELRRSTKTLDPSCKSCGSFAGIIYALGGAGFQDVKIELRSMDRSTSIQVYSAENGRFRVDGLPPGIYELITATPEEQSLQREHVGYLEIMQGRTLLLLIDHRNPGVIAWSDAYEPELEDEPVVVDTSSATQRFSLRSEFLRSLPRGYSLW